MLYNLNDEDMNPRNIYRKDLDTKSVESIKFSESGKILAIGGSDVVTGFGYVSLWDIELKATYGPELKGFTSGITHIEFSTGDKLIAASSRDNTVRIWDMDADNIYDLPVVLDDHEDEWVWSCDFHPDGTRIMTAAGNGIIREFPVKPDEMIAQICGLLNRNMDKVEWRQFVAKEDDIPYQITCADHPGPDEGIEEEVSEGE